MLIRLTLICGLTPVLLLVGGCGGDDKSDSSADDESTPAASSGQEGDAAGSGEFTSGTVNLATPSGEATLDLSEGQYVTVNDTVVANFADGEANDPAANQFQVAGSPGDLYVTMFGPLQGQRVTTECTVDAPTLGPSGIEGTFECQGGASGTFEAH